MSQIDRRSLARSLLASALSLPAVAAIPRRAAAVLANASPNSNTEIAAQVQREQVWALFRSYALAYDTADLPGFLAHFVQSDQTVFEDVTANLSLPGYTTIAGAFSQVLAADAAVVGAGKIYKLFHVAGDVNYGAVIEHVYPKGVFFSTNGITVQSVIDLDGGLIARDTDYWDSRELGASDIVGPADTSGVATPSAPVHPGGVPLSSTTPAPPGAVALATGVTGKPSASPELVGFVQQFHAALAAGSVRDILSFFTEDAVYANPLIHQGPVLYGNYDQTIQIAGLDLIAGLFRSTIRALPDCLGSTLVHVVGGAPGGGFEWKAGGRYAGTGVNRNGLSGCTMLELFDWKIRRMSVKFDTFQLPVNAYDGIRSVLAAAGITDQ